MSVGIFIRCEEARDECQSVRGESDGDGCEGRRGRRDFERVESGSRFDEFFFVEDRWRLRCG